MKIYICYVLAHPVSCIWERSCSWDISQNGNALSQPFRLQKSTISPETSAETPYFLHVDKNSRKLKLIKFIFFWLGMVKNGCGQSGLWTLKLMLSQEWTDGVKWFFACWYNFTQKVIENFGLSMAKDDRSLKLTVSEEWTDEINWFLACW